jgi:hypothetical protein
MLLKIIASPLLILQTLHAGIVQKTLSLFHKLNSELTESITQYQEGNIPNMRDVVDAHCEALRDDPTLKEGVTVHMLFYSLQHRLEKVVAGNSDSTEKEQVQIIAQKLLGSVLPDASQIPTLESCPQELLQVLPELKKIWLTTNLDPKIKEVFISLALIQNTSRQDDEVKALYLALTLHKVSKEQNLQLDYHHFLVPSPDAMAHIEDVQQSMNMALAEKIVFKDNKGLWQTLIRLVLEKASEKAALGQQPPAQDERETLAQEILFPIKQAIEGSFSKLGILPESKTDRVFSKWRQVVVHITNDPNQELSKLILEIIGLAKKGEIKEIERLTEKLQQLLSDQIKSKNHKVDISTLEKALKEKFGTEFEEYLELAAKICQIEINSILIQDSRVQTSIDIVLGQKNPKISFEQALKKLAILTYYPEIWRGIHQLHDSQRGNEPLTDSEKTEVANRLTAQKIGLGLSTVKRILTNALIIFLATGTAGLSLKTTLSLTVIQMMLNGVTDKLSDFKHPLKQGWVETLPSVINLATTYMFYGPVMLMFQMLMDGISLNSERQLRNQLQSNTTEPALVQTENLSTFLVKYAVDFSSKTIKVPHFEQKDKQEIWKVNTVTETPDSFEISLKHTESPDLSLRVQITGGTPILTKEYNITPVLKESDCYQAVLQTLVSTQPKIGDPLKLPKLQGEGNDTWILAEYGRTKEGVITATLTNPNDTRNSIRIRIVGDEVDCFRDYSISDKTKDITREEEEQLKSLTSIFDSNRSSMVGLKVKAPKHDGTMVSDWEITKVSKIDTKIVIELKAPKLENYTLTITNEDELFKLKYTLQNTSKQLLPKVENQTLTDPSKVQLTYSVSKFLQSSHEQMREVDKVMDKERERIKEAASAPTKWLTSYARVMADPDIMSDAQKGDYPEAVKTLVKSVFKSAAEVMVFNVLLQGVVGVGKRTGNFFGYWLDSPLQKLGFGLDLSAEDPSKVMTKINDYFQSQTTAISAANHAQEIQDELVTSLLAEVSVMRRDAGVFLLSPPKSTPNYLGSWLGIDTEAIYNAIFSQSAITQGIQAVNDQFNEKIRQLNPSSKGYEEVVSVLKEAKSTYLSLYVAYGINYESPLSQVLDGVIAIHKGAPEECREQVQDEIVKNILSGLEARFTKLEDIHHIKAEFDAISTEISVLVHPLSAAIKEKFSQFDLMKIVVQKLEAGSLSELAQKISELGVSHDAAFQPYLKSAAESLRDKIGFKELKKQYRKLSLLHHPDRTKTPDQSAKLWEFFAPIYEEAEKSAA